MIRLTKEISANYPGSLSWLLLTIAVLGFMTSISSFFTKGRLSGKSILSDIYILVLTIILLDIISPGYRFLSFLRHINAGTTALFFLGPVSFYRFSFFQAVINWRVFFIQLIPCFICLPGNLLLKGNSQTLLTVGLVHHGIYLIFTVSKSLRMFNGTGLPRLDAFFSVIHLLLYTTILITVFLFTERFEVLIISLAVSLMIVLAWLFRICSAFFSIWTHYKTISFQIINPKKLEK